MNSVQIVSCWTMRHSLCRAQPGGCVRHASMAITGAPDGRSVEPHYRAFCLTRAPHFGGTVERQRALEVLHSTMRVCCRVGFICSPERPTVGRRRMLPSQHHGEPGTCLPGITSDLHNLGTHLALLRNFDPASCLPLSCLSFERIDALTIPSLTFDDNQRHLQIRHFLSIDI